jgi:hypothetical protein
MRAKMQVTNVQIVGEDSTNPAEILSFTAVGKSEPYDEAGNDENNSYAKWTPQASLNMTVNNPDLFGKFAAGQEYYLDFTLVE